MYNLKKGKFKLSIKHNYINKDKYYDQEFIDNCFLFVEPDIKICTELISIYKMQEQTKLIKDAVKRTNSLITNYVIDTYSCNFKKGESEKERQDFISKKIQLLLDSSPFKSVNTMIPTNTAKNIADSVISQITNDPMPILSDIDDKDFIDSVMDSSMWEMFIKNIVKYACITGVSAYTINLDDDKNVYFDTEEIDNIVFITQGNSIIVSYLRVNDDSDTYYYIYDSSKITIMKNGIIQEEVSHLFGVPPLQAICFFKDTGIFETCLGDIGAYDMAYYVAVHALSDPKNIILDTGSSIRDMVMSGTKDMSDGTRWISKPTSDLLALCNDVRKEALENIVDDTSVVPERLLRTQMSTATQSNLVMDKFNSMIRSFGNMIKQRMRPALIGLQNYAQSTGKNVGNLFIDPNIKELVNINQKLELMQTLNIPKEALRLMGYDDNRIERILEEDLLLKKGYNDMELTEFVEEVDNQ